VCCREQAALIIRRLKGLGVRVERQGNRGESRRGKQEGKAGGKSRREKQEGKAGGKSRREKQEGKAGGWDLEKIIGGDLKEPPPIWFHWGSTLLLVAVVAFGGPLVLLEVAPLAGRMSPILTKCGYLAPLVGLVAFGAGHFLHILVLFMREGDVAVFGVQHDDGVVGSGGEAGTAN
jgi:hypothetical protein